MSALFKRELMSFFSTITGGLVVVVFLVLTGLFIWVIPGEFNVLYGGYATLESLFYLAPWVYLFLIPAVTMRLFADEKKAGTLDLLMTRPVTEYEVVIAKYMAGLTVVIISLLPTLLYYFSVYRLGNPVGNIDAGGTLGSYIGLVLLAGVYTSIGVFSSTLSDNQIVAFVVAVLLSFLFYSGFDSLAQVPGLKSVADYIQSIGIEQHYTSIRRGVVDTRDVAYFFSVIIFFLFVSRQVIAHRKK